MICTARIASGGRSAGLVEADLIHAVTSQAGLDGEAVRSCLMLAVQADGAPVVVGYDGSSASSLALDFGLDYARRHHLRVRVVAAQPLHTEHDRVTGMDARDIGIVAGTAGITLYELSPQSASLEEAFMELTRDAAEYTTTRGAAA